MINKVIIALVCVLSLSACRAQNSAIDAGDVVGLFDYMSTIPDDEQAESRADSLMARATEVFTARGFTRGLTGEGYGGPCVIIDGFYKGGQPDTVNYRFAPATRDACVMEMSCCNDGDGGDHTLHASVTLYSLDQAQALLNQLTKRGFTMIERPHSGQTVYSNGSVVVEYYISNEYFGDSGGDDTYIFEFTTAADWNSRSELPVDDSDRDYQGGVNS